MPTSHATTVVIAHGSRAAEANDAHRAVCAALADRTGVPVLAAFLELAEPSLGEAVDLAVAAGAGQVVVVPLFLYPGRHSRTDIPALVERARADHPATTIELGGLFGDDPAMVDLLARQVERLT